MIDSSDQLIGSLVLGRYRIVRPLAQGGMGAVYLARVEGAAGFSRPVVIKRVLPHLSGTKNSKEQFIREARILSNLQHPSIVGVIDFAEEQGALLMVLDYVHGYHLGQWLKYVKQERGRLPWEACVLIMLRVLAALHYAHTFTRSDGSKAGVVHRDVSPGNILLDIDGNVRLLDFGIASMDEEKAGYQTQDGTFKGKLPYVAPEIYGSQKATPRSDVYAAAVVLYQLLSGENPFAAKEMSDTVRRVLTLSPAPLHELRSDVPPELDAVVARALAKDPTQRPDSAESFAAELRSIMQRREDEVFAELSVMIRADFTGDMPKKLKVHTLSLLEAAWRDAQTGPEDSFTPLKSSVPPTVREKLLVVAGEASPQVGVRGEPVEPAAAPASPSAVTVERKGISPKQLIAAMLAAALLAGGVAVGAVLLTRAPAPAPAQRFLVVEATDTAPGSTLKASAAPAPAATQVEPEASASMSAPSASSTAPAKQLTKAPGGSGDAARLSRAFAAKQGAIQGCFQAHTQNLEGTPQISVHFDIDRSGRVTAARVLPGALAGTGLGQCLSGVARSTHFGPQSEPRAFTIPIHARVH